MFIEEGNRERGQKSNQTEVMSNALLKFSDCQEKESNFAIKKPIPLSEDEVIHQYLTEKQTKKLDCLFMMKVNEELVKSNPSNELQEQLSVFESNESEIKRNLLEQMHTLQMKLSQRKMCSFLNGLVRRCGSVCQEKCPWWRKIEG